MRAWGLPMLAVAIVACQQAPEPAPSAARPTVSASPGASCEQIRQDVRREQARLAKLPQTCDSDADCDLYGGHECPNALARTCPDAVAKSSAKAMRPLEDAWEARHCGEVLWSPYLREAVCEAGVCVGR
ncbi:MAG: hypothetical protein H6716_19140 [Polyangiaceae bacterium]|nr:hypothetical protein [Polyangiaceae bacterium]